MAASATENSEASFCQNGADSDCLDLSGSALAPGALADALRAAAQSGIPYARLELADADLGDADAEELARFVASQASPLERLNLADNHVTALGMARLCAAFAGHRLGAYPALELGGAVVPCLLELRGNAVDRPAAALAALRRRGVLTCAGRRCTRRACLAAAPVHLGLACQVFVQRWRAEDLDALVAEWMPMGRCPPPPMVAVAPGQRERGSEEGEGRGRLPVPPLAPRPASDHLVPPRLLAGQPVQRQRERYCEFSDQPDMGLLADEVLRVVGPVPPACFGHTGRVEVAGQSGRTYVHLDEVSLVLSGLQ